MFPRLTNFILLIVAVAACLGALEIGLSYLNRSGSDAVLDGKIPVSQTLPEISTDIHEYHPFYGHSVAPNFRGNWEGEITTNSFGNRSPEITVQKPTGTFRVLFAGDSQTWGTGLNDWETISFQTEAALHEETGLEIDTINQGVSGYAPDQAMLRYRLEGEQFSPDTVVLTYFPDNDLDEIVSLSAWGVGRPRSYLRGGMLCLSNIPPPRVPGWKRNRLAKMFQGPAVPDFTPGFEIAWRNSNIVRFFSAREFRPEMLRTADELLEYGRLREVTPCIERSAYSVKANSTDAIELLFGVLTRFRTAVESRGSRFIVVFKPRQSTFGRRRNVEDETVLNRLAAERFDVLDPEPLLIARGLTTMTAMSRGRHLGPQATQIVAQELAHLLKPDVAARR